MRNLIFSLLLLSGEAANAQESILDFAEGYSIQFDGLARKTIQLNLLDFTL